MSRTLPPPANVSQDPRTDLVRVAACQLSTACALQTLGHVSCEKNRPDGWSHGNNFSLGGLHVGADAFCYGNHEGLEGSVVSVSSVEQEQLQAAGNPTQTHIDDAAGQVEHVVGTHWES